MRVSRKDVSKLVRSLESKKVAQRVAAVEALYALGPYGRLMRIGMSAKDGLTVLRGAFRADWPKTDDWDSATRNLLLSLCQVPHKQYLPLILKHYPRLRSDEEQWQALMLLANMPQREAAEAWIKWYRERW